MTDDLRDWLRQVERLGELKKVDGADWDLEIGCIAALNAKKKGSVLLFDNIKGYPAGYRVLTSVNLRASTVALTLSLPQGLSDFELANAWITKHQECERRAAEFPPEVVATGPVMENVHSGDAVDVLAFPSPRWHDLDGGRYIGTGCAVITRDPDTGDINLGTYRVMIHDTQTVALFIQPDRHGRRHLEKYHERGQPCPVAVSVGHHPLIARVAATPVLMGMEYGFAGAIRGRPIQVVMEKVTGLPIPADSEIVLAGWCPPNKMKDEGPFGEWTGYYGSSRRPEPVLEVKRIYHRNDPIILGHPPNRPLLADTAYVEPIQRSAALHSYLIKCGIPDVKRVWVSELARVQWIVVSIKQRYAGHAKQVGLAVTASRMASDGGRYVIVVDDDIDPTNIEDVVWAMASRADPATGIQVITKAATAQVDPLARVVGGTVSNSRAIIDACRPFESMEQFPKAITMSPELVARVREKWGSILS